MKRSSVAILLGLVFFAAVGLAVTNRWGALAEVPEAPSLFSGKVRIAREKNSKVEFLDLKEVTQVQIGQREFLLGSPVTEEKTQGGAEDVHGGIEPKYLRVYVPIDDIKAIYLYQLSDDAPSK